MIGWSEQITEGRTTNNARDFVDRAEARNEVEDGVGNFRATALGQFQFVVSEFDDLGLSVEFSHEVK